LLDYYFDDFVEREIHVYLVEIDEFIFMEFFKKIKINEVMCMESFGISICIVKDDFR